MDPSQPNPTFSTDLPPPSSVPPQVPGRRDPAVVKKVIIGSAIFGVVAAIVLLSVVALNLYTTNTPEYLLAQAFRNLGSQRGTAGDITIQYKDDGKTYRAEADFITFTDITDDTRREVTIGTGSGGSRIEATVRQLPDGAYGRVTNLAQVPEFLDTFRPGTSRLYQDADTQALLRDRSGQWYALTPPQAGPAALPPDNQLARAAQLPDSRDLRQAANLYREHPFLRVVQRHNDQAINGTAHARIRLAVDTQNLLAFARAAQKQGVLPLVFTRGTIDWLQRHLAGGVPSVEVWITKSTRQFGRIAIAGAGGNLALTVNLHPSLPPGKTAVDHPSIFQRYDDAAADLQMLLDAKQSGSRSK